MRSRAYYLAVVSAAPIHAGRDRGGPIAFVLPLSANAVDGITEMRMIVTLASTYGLPVVPHANESCNSAAHLLFAKTEGAYPLGEWG